MMKKIAFTVVLSALSYVSQSQPSLAGWFGPSNYDECVLSKMKGQEGYMMPNAQRACRAEFPESKNQVSENDILDSSMIKYVERQMLDNGDLAIFINDKPRAFKITSARGIFDDSACPLSEHRLPTVEDIARFQIAENAVHDPFTAISTTDENIFRFAIKPDQIKCISITFYGKVIN